MIFKNYNDMCEKKLVFYVVNTNDKYVFCQIMVTQHVSIAADSQQLKC